MHSIPDNLVFVFFWTGYILFSILGAYTGFIFGLGRGKRIAKQGVRR